MKKLETQISIYLFLIILIISLLMFIPLIGSDYHKINFIVISTILIDIIIILLFYKMDIIILNNKYLVISFGIGIIKKKILLNDINSYEETKIPIWYGIGIRLLSKNTWLYNSRNGKGVKIKTKSNETFLISINNINSLKQYFKIDY